MTWRKFLLIVAVAAAVVCSQVAFGAPARRGSSRYLRSAVPPPSKKTGKVARAKRSASRPRPAATLVERIDAVINQPHLRSTQWAVLVQDMQSGGTVYRCNSETTLLPASNRKVFTTALALDRLGPDFRFATDLHLVGRKDTQGRFRGDLVVVARGDPTFSSRWSKTGRPDERFREWADALLAGGVKRIQGDLVIDVSAFDPSERYGAGWDRDQLECSYSAPVGAFSFNENLITARVLPGRTLGAPCRVELLPLAADFQIANSSWTSGSRRASLVVRRRDESHVIEVKGCLPQQAAPRSATVAVAYPARYAGQALMKTLEDRGVRVVGSLRVSEQPVALPPGLRPVVHCESPPLSDILKEINQDSNNFLAEHVYRAVALHETGRGSYEAAHQVEARFLRRVGIEPAGMGLEDGCGLSRQNRVSPAAVVRLLKAMSGHPYARVFLDSLSVSGEKGVLRNRLGEKDCRGRIRGKTGFLKGVAALSGYADRPDGKRLVFSILANFPPSEGAYSRIKAMDDICRELLRWPSIPTTG